MTELNRIDFLILQLVSVKDYTFIEYVLSEYRGVSYDQLPQEISGELTDILEARLFDIGEEEIQA